MRTGRWSKETDFGEGTKERAGFPPQPAWFKNNLDHANLAGGLGRAGFSKTEIAKIMGGNWLAFFDANFGKVSPA